MKAILSSTPSVRLHTLKGWVPSAPAIQAGVVYVRCVSGVPGCRSSWPPTPLGHPSSQRAVCVVACSPVSDSQIREPWWNFSLFPIVVEVRGDMKGYLGSSQVLFDSFFLLFQLSFGQMEVPLFLFIALWNHLPLSSGIYGSWWDQWWEEALKGLGLAMMGWCDHWWIQWLMGMF